MGVGGVGAEEGAAAGGISPPLKDDIIEDDQIIEEDGVEKFEEGSEKADGNPDQDDKEDVEPAQDLSKSGENPEVSRPESPIEEEEEKGE